MKGENTICVTARAMSWDPWVGQTVPPRAPIYCPESILQPRDMPAMVLTRLTFRTSSAVIRILNNSLGLYHHLCFIEHPALLSHVQILFTKDIRNSTRWKYWQKMQSCQTFLPVVEQACTDLNLLTLFQAATVGSEFNWSSSIREGRISSSYHFPSLNNSHKNCC